MQEKNESNSNIFMVTNKSYHSTIPTEQATKTVSFCLDFSLGMLLVLYMGKQYHNVGQ